MTSASVIWMLAAVGGAIGLGHYPEAIALTFISAGVLVGVQRLERVFRALRRGVHAEEDPRDVRTTSDEPRMSGIGLEDPRAPR
jgi:putative Mg2+ transporter-C (MgtC) family protein